MQRKIGLVVLSCAFAALLGTALVHAEERPVVCVACHSFLGGPLAKPVEEWNGSIHRQNGITCDMCHGGNAHISVGRIASLSGQAFAELRTSAMSRAAGFTAKPSGKELFDICARCHGDSVERYAGSIMGRAYLAGKGGPSCVTCHGAHNNVIPAVPKVCEGCHQDTSGFDRIDPMNVTEATINELSRIRISLAEDKARGTRPALAPGFPEDLDPYQIGLLSFGGVLAVFFLGYLVYRTLEKRS